MGRPTSGAAAVAAAYSHRRFDGKSIAMEAGLQHYLRSINDAPLLTAEMERDLGLKVRAQYEAGNRLECGEIDMAAYDQILADAQDARMQMVRSNLRLVVNIAKQFSNRGMLLSDLIEEGNLGLLRAVEGYDPSHETRFSTYASWWIKQAIKRALINSVQAIHIPAYMVEEISRWKQATAELEDKNGRPPTMEELCSHLQIKPRRARIIRKAIRAISNPTRAAEQEEGLTLSEMIADDKTPQPDVQVASDTDAESVHELLGKLDEREATILRLRFGLLQQDGMTLKEIGKKIGLTRERVRQIEHEALDKMNKMLSGD